MQAHSTARTVVRMKTFNDMTDAEKMAVGTIAETQDAEAKAEEWLRTIHHDRNTSIITLRGAGWKLTEMAALTGLSISYIQKLTRKA